MRRAIVAFVISAFLISVPLFTALAADTFGKAEGVKEIVANVASKVVLGGPILIMATLVNAYVGLLGLLSLQMIHFFLKLAAFNNFINFLPVIQGWTIIRDVVNMSFVIILLMIAISTILGIEAYSYRRLLPRLVLMAVLINFSRTIAGLLIDAGQVVMLTFVNAFSAAAGGNFINALHINDLLSIANAGILSLDVTPITIFSSYILAAVAITVTFIVMLVFAGILLFRILSLWFLIVLSPLAFALGAWPSGGVSKYYGQWWDEFTKNIICPTVLSFFLWLALMMMSSNYVTVLAPGLGGAGEKGAPLEAAVTQLAIPETFASFLIGIGFLLMVLKMTQSLCGSIAGFAPKILDFAKKQGIAAAKLAGKGTLLGVGATVGLAGKGIGAGLSRAGIKVPQVPMTTISKFKEGGLSVMGGIPIVRGWAMGKLGEERAKQGKSFGVGSSKMDQMNSAEKDRLVDQKPPVITRGNAAERAGALHNALNDPELKKYWKEKYGEEGANERAKGVLAEYNQVTKVTSSPEITRKAIDVKKANPHLLAEGADFNDVMSKMEKEDVRKLTPEVWTKTMKRADMTEEAKASWLKWAEDGSVGLRSAAAKYRTDQKDEAKKSPDKQQKLWERELIERKEEKAEHDERTQNISEEDLENPLIALELVQNSDFSKELSNVLKDNNTRKVLKNVLAELRKQTLKGARKDAKGNILPATEGTGATAKYAPEIQAVSEAALLAGAGLDQTFNIDVKTGDIKEDVDRNSFQTAMQGSNKIGIILNSNLDAIVNNNYNNKVAEAVAKSLTYEDIRNLMDGSPKGSAAEGNAFNAIEALRQYVEHNPKDERAKAVIEEIDSGSRQLKARLAELSHKLGGSEEIKKQIEAQVKKVSEAEAKRLSLEKARDSATRADKRQQINEQLQEALEREQKEKEQLNKLKS